LDTRRLYELHCRALQKAQLKHLRFHDLRHTFATLLLEKGEDIKTIQELLRHQDICTTLNTYAHVTQKMKAASAARVESIMAGALPQGQDSGELNAEKHTLIEPAGEIPRLRLVTNNGKRIHQNKSQEKRIM
jgi:hypothetical protein